MKRSIMVVALLLGTIGARAAFGEQSQQVKDKCEKPATAELRAYCALYVTVAHMGSGEFYHWGENYGREYYSARANHELAIAMVKILLPEGDQTRAALLSIIGEPPDVFGGYPVLEGPGGKHRYVDCSFTDTRMSKATGYLEAKILP